MVVFLSLVISFCNVSCSRFASGIYILLWAPVYWNCSYLDEIKHPLLLQGTIEEKIYQRQTAKQGLSGTVADSKETVKVEFSRDELKVSIQSDWLFLTFVSYV